MREKEYLTGIAAFTYFGSARIKLLYSYFKSAEKIWNISKKELEEVGIPEKKVMEFLEFKSSFDIKSYFKHLEKLNIKVTTFLDKNFPENLIDLDGAPVLLYYKGNLSALKRNSVAIVGTRKMTSYGREVTEKFSGELANFGVTIISGLARGIDTMAHKACILAGGSTVAVLGNGLDIIYPPENKFLAEEIVNKNGAIISEYPLGYPALPVNFAVRNRIVSGLSDAVLVIEGAEGSGTLLTANSAGQQGKTVFAVPGQITSPLSFVPHLLLKNGAKMATAPNDILDEIGMALRLNRSKMEEIIPKTPEEEKLLAFIENEPLHLDELVRISGEKTSDVSARLTIMEMKGLVKNLGRGMYRKI